MTQTVRQAEPLAEAPYIRSFPVRTPTLPPATHTNVYLVGEGAITVFDPASPYPEERAALDAAIDSLASAGHRVREIVLTHHHVDHVSGAEHLAARLGVGVAAHPETAARLAGRLSIARVLDEQQRITTAGPDGLAILHTPGHAPGHLCFFDEASGALIAGDMVASVGTIIVEPDDGGDMIEYLDSLIRLRRLGARVLLPAHGPPIRDADARLDFYLAHRLEREQRVLGALAAEPRTVEELLPACYPDVPTAVYPLASRSLYAHLIKLEREGRARRVGAGWVM